MNFGAKLLFLSLLAFHQGLASRNVWTYASYDSWMFATPLNFDSAQFRWPFQEYEISPNHPSVFFSLSSEVLADLNEDSIYKEEIKGMEEGSLENHQDFNETVLKQGQNVPLIARWNKFKSLEGLPEHPYTCENLGAPDLCTQLFTQYRDNLHRVCSYATMTVTLYVENAKFVSGKMRIGCSARDLEMEAYNEAIRKFTEENRPITTTPQDYLADYPEDYPEDYAGAPESPPQPEPVAVPAKEPVAVPAEVPAAVPAEVVDYPEVADYAEAPESPPQPAPKSPPQPEPVAVPAEVRMAIPTEEPVKVEAPEESVEAEAAEVANNLV